MKTAWLLAFLFLSAQLAAEAKADGVRLYRIGPYAELPYEQKINFGTFIPLLKVSYRSFIETEINFSKCFLSNTRSSYPDRAACLIWMDYRTWLKGGPTDPTEPNTTRTHEHHFPNELWDKKRKRNSGSRVSIFYASSQGIIFGD